MPEERLTIILLCAPFLLKIHITSDNSYLMKCLVVSLENFRNHHPEILFLLSGMTIYSPHMLIPPYFLVHMSL